MGKKGSIGYGTNKKSPLTSQLLHPHQPVSLRHQAGRPGGSGGASPQALNPSAQVAALRAEHLLRIATWASANVPPLGSLLGARLGCLCEAAGVPAPDTPHSICERCESIMQLGVNCSVRVTKNKRTGKSSKAGNVCNYVTYICRFCKHGNAKPGTSKNHLKTKISQAAARANLEMLGSKRVHQVSVENGPLDVTEQKQLVGAEQEDAKVVKMALDKVEQEGAKAVETTVDKVEQEGAKVVEITLDKVEQTGAEAAEITLDKVEQESAVVVEMILDKDPLDLMDKSHQGPIEQEDASAVETTLDKGPLDRTVKSQQEFAEQEGLEAAKTTLEKGPLDLTENSQQGSAEQLGPKSVEISLTKKTLDITKKKKKEKKKDQQGSAELDSERLRPSLSKGPVVESIDSTKKRKRKGWSALKELAGIPQ